MIHYSLNYEYYHQVKNFELTDAIKSFVNEKVGALGRFEAKILEARGFGKRDQAQYRRCFSRRDYDVRPERAFCEAKEKRPIFTRPLTWRFKK